MIKKKKVKELKLNSCPKCQSENISIRYRTGVVGFFKIPYFYGTVKCMFCKFFLESKNPEKLIKTFGVKE
jgi:transcription elongation factor Elf1